MLDYIGSLPMWVQLIIVFGGLIVGLITISSMLYRLVKYGIKIKAGPIEIDASEENSKGGKNAK